MFSAIGMLADTVLSTFCTWYVTNRDWAFGLLLVVPIVSLWTMILAGPLRVMFTMLLCRPALVTEIGPAVIV